MGLSQGLRNMNMFLFVAMMGVSSFGDAALANHRSIGFDDNVKYLILLAAILFSWAELILLRKREKKTVFEKEFHGIVLFVAAMTAISLIDIGISSHYTFDSFLYLGRILLPAVYAFLILNTFSFSDIRLCMKLSLIVFALAYVNEKGIAAFSLANLRRISFFDSRSPFESNAMSGPAIAMCGYFCYYRSEKKWMWASLILTFLTFKRVWIVAGLILWLAPKLVDKDKQVGRGWIKAAKAFFFFATIAMYFLLQAHNIAAVDTVFHINLDQLMTGRVRLYNILLDSNFVSSGIGSSIPQMAMLVPGKGNSIELEMLQIFVETGIIGLFFFVNTFWNLPGKNLYCVLLLSFIMLNILMSSALAGTFNWIIRYVTLGSILYLKPEMEEQPEKNRETSKYIKSMRSITNRSLGLL